MPNSYDVGDRVRVDASFTDASKAKTDPTTVTFKYKDPSGNVTTEQYGSGNVVKDATGDYHLEIDLDEAGRWDYRAEGAGAVKAAGEGDLVVRTSAFP